MINLLQTVRFGLQVFPFASERLNQLDVEIEEHAETLTNSIYN